MSIQYPQYTTKQIAFFDKKTHFVYNRAVFNYSHTTMSNGPDIQIGERLDIPRNHPDLPEATTYEKFRDILKNTKGDPMQKTIEHTQDFIVRPGKGNAEATRSTNTYAVETINNQWQKILLCYVVGQDKMEQFADDYTNEEITKHQIKVKLQIIEWIEKTSGITSRQNELWELRERVVGFDFTEQWVKDFFKIQRDEAKHVTKQYDHRAWEVKHQDKMKLKTSPLEKEMFELLNFSIEEWKSNIKRLEKSLDDLEKEYKKWLLSEPMRKEKTSRVTTELRNHTLQQEHIGQIINSVIVSSDQMMPELDIKLPITSSESAEKVRKVYSRMAIERLIKNTINLETDLRKIQGQHHENLDEYLQTFLDTGVNTWPFIPAPGHEDAFNNIKIANPEIAKYLDSFMPTVTNIKTDKSDNGSNNPNGQEIYNNPKYLATPGKGWFLDKITLWFISQGIDNSSMSPSEKEWAKKVAGIVSLIGLWALAIRWWKKVFSKDSKFEGKDRFIGGLAATLFAWSIITSKNHNPLDFKSLWNKVASRFSSNPENIPGNENNAAPEKTTLWGIVSMNTIFEGMNWAQIKSILKDDNGKMSINYDAAKIVIETNKWNISNANERLQIIESLRNSPNQALVPVALNALGITSEKLAQNTGKKYEEFAEKGIDNFMSIYEYMQTNWYKRRNKEMTSNIYKYMRWEQGYSLDKLAKMWAFEKDEVLTENTGLKANIEGLKILNADQKADFYNQSLKVFKELKDPKSTNYQWTFDIIEKNNKLYLKTYNQETEINLENKKIGNLPLYTTYQTLKAANLTNRLQDVFKGKSDTEKPFNIWLWGDIEFQKNSLNSTEWWKNLRQFAKDKFDTEAVAAWRGGTLKDIAPSLEDNKQIYVDYLNSLPWRKK